MPKFEVDNLSPEQKLIVDIFIFEGVLRGYEEIIAALTHEYALSQGEDPYYGYYIKHVIDLVEERYQSLKKEVED